MKLIYAVMLVAFFGFLGYMAIGEGTINNTSGQKGPKHQSTKANERVCVPSKISMITGDIHLLVDVFPTFPGGDSGYNAFVKRHLAYTDDMGEGRVIISFVVEQDGNLTQVKAIHGPSELAEQEAVRVVKLSPKWKPGILDGKAVRTQFTVPVMFR